MITIAIPVYNREVLVKRALESALRQPGDDIEILVIDNASTDRTWEVLESYRDPRLRLVRNDRNVGLFGNFNRCMTLARGRYLCTLCSDDLLSDGFLGPARDVLDPHPSISVVSSRGRARIEQTGAIRPLGAALPAGAWAPGDAIAAVLWAWSTFYTNPFNYPSGILLRTEAARAAGMMDERFAFSADVKLYLAMLETGGLAILDVEGCEVLLHGGQEGDKIYRDGRALSEFEDHFHRYASVLASHGLEHYVKAHVAGFLYGSYFKLRRQGKDAAARTCLTLLRERRYPRLAGLVAGADSLRQRVARNGARARACPVRFEPSGGAG